MTTATNATAAVTTAPNATAAANLATTAAAAATEDSKISLGFKLQQTFSSQLTNTSSEEYKTLAAKVKAAVSNLVVLDPQAEAEVPTVTVKVFFELHYEKALQEKQTKDPRSTKLEFLQDKHTKSAWLTRLNYFEIYIYIKNKIHKVI